MMEDIYSEIKKIFSVSIKKYKQSAIDKDVIFYEVEITSKQEKTILDKRYSDFERLHKDLKKIFENLPSFPSKTIFKISNNPEELMKRRDMLDNYIIEIIKRPEILSSEPLKNFLCIDKIAPEISVIPPTVYVTIPNFSYGIRDFIFLHEEGVMFTLASDMNPASRLGSYINNMKKPWQDDSTPNIVTSSVGILECYVSSKEDKFNLKRLWFKSFGSQAISMFLDPSSKQIAVGFDDGSAYVGKVSSELIYVADLYYEKLHDARIMGLAIDSINDTLITISKDQRLKVTKLSTKKIIFNCAVSYADLGLSNSYYDIKTKKFIASDMNGVVLIYDLQKPEPDIRQRFETTNKTGIRGLHFDPVNNLLFTGSIDNGEICMFRIDLIGKETSANAALTVKSKTQVRCLAWSMMRKEVYSGHEDGTITVWDMQYQTPIYVIKNSEGSITKLSFLEKDRLLICASKEKYIKVWQMPEAWTLKQFEENRNQSPQKEQREVQREVEGYEDGDLGGWNKD